MLYYIFIICKCQIANGKSNLSNLTTPKRFVTENMSRSAPSQTIQAEIPHFHKLPEPSPDPTKLNRLASALVARITASSRTDDKSVNSFNGFEEKSTFITIFVKIAVSNRSDCLRNLSVSSASSVSFFFFCYLISPNEWLLLFLWNSSFLLDELGQIVPTIRVIIMFSCMVLFLRSLLVWCFFVVFVLLGLIILVEIFLGFDSIIIE